LLGNDEGWFSASEGDELWRTLVGDYLGGGCYRKVFALKHSPDLVIKVEQNEGVFHNVREWDVWETIQYCPRWRRWVAPCVAISPRGNFLIQRRTEPVRKLPARLPGFLTDLKPENFGRLGGKIVCHDYSTVVPDLSLRLRKINHRD